MWWKLLDSSDSSVVRLDANHYSTSNNHWPNILSKNKCGIYHQNFVQESSQLFIFVICSQCVNVCSTLVGGYVVFDFTNNLLNSLWPSDAIWWHISWSTLPQPMACCLTGTKPLPEPVLTYHHWGSVTITWWQFWRVTKIRLKITYSKFHLNLLGARELKCKKYTCIAQFLLLGYPPPSDESLRQPSRGSHFDTHTRTTHLHTTLSGVRSQIWDVSIMFLVSLAKQVTSHCLNQQCSSNGLSHVWLQAIGWTNYADLLSIRNLGINSSSRKHIQENTFYRPLFWGFNVSMN